MIETKNRIRSMDTLRSIAILIVLLAHTVLGFGAPAALAPLQLGGMGVDLFFVLSGWLLGGQLFKEMSQGSINVRRFWARRWLRTLPAYYAVLLFTIAQQLLTKDDPANPWAFFFFIQNYHYPLEIFFVSWSLAVEEQFYLLVAPLLALSLYLSPAKRLAALLFILVLPSVFRYFELYGTTVETHVRLDGCVMGVVLACIRYQHSAIWAFLLRYSGIMALLASGLFIFSFFQRWYPVSWFGDPDFLLRAVMFGAWVVYANSNQFVKRNLYFPGATYVATRSYAIYLLHPDAIAITNRLPFEMHFYIYVLVVVFFSLVASEILYRCIEVPFMRLRDHIKVTR